MKLRTSFFNPTVLKKDITRFAPVWALYTIFACLFVLLLGTVEAHAAFQAEIIAFMIPGMVFVNLLYAPAAAFLLFGDLFQSKLCNALHAMPMRREGWFLTHLTAGLFFGIVPNLIPCLLACTYLDSYCYLAFLWLGATVLQYLFFFGVACFAVHCAGNRIGAIAIYGIFNFFPMLVAWVANTFYVPLLYGLEVPYEVFAHYSPVVGLCQEYVNIKTESTPIRLVFEGFLPATWRYLFICAAIGVVLLGVCVILYRKRHLESAGDMISFRPAAPVFLVIYTLCVGTMLFTAGSLSDGALPYLFLIIGLAVGFFTGKMLLERKVRVFEGKSFLQYGILTLVFFLTLGITALDPFGVTRFVPETASVEAVHITMSHYYYDIENDSVRLTDPQAIEDVRQVQKLCLENRYDEDDMGEYDKLLITHQIADQGVAPLTIQYTLTNGNQITRKYYIDPTGADGQLLRPYFSSSQAVFSVEDPLVLLEYMRRLQVDREDLGHPVLIVGSSVDDLDPYFDELYGNTPSYHSYALPSGNFEEDAVLIGLLEAMKKDCEEGNLCQDYYFHSPTSEVFCYIEIQLNKTMPDTVSLSNLEEAMASVTKSYLSIRIYKEAKHTVAYLQNLDSKFE